MWRRKKIKKKKSCFPTSLRILQIYIVITCLITETYTSLPSHSSYIYSHTSILQVKNWQKEDNSNVQTHLTHVCDACSHLKNEYLWVYSVPDVGFTKKTWAILKGLRLQQQLPMIHPDLYSKAIQTQRTVPCRGKDHRMKHNLFTDRLNWSIPADFPAIKAFLSLICPAFNCQIHF